MSSESQPKNAMPAPQSPAPISADSPVVVRGGRTSSVAYEASFDNIVRLIGSLRRQEVSGDEYNVTKALAGPFRVGGLLVLLQEPLGNHPWSKGADTVVSSCPTLNMLNEAICVASNGVLNLINHVS